MFVAEHRKKPGPNVHIFFLRDKNSYLTKSRNARSLDPLRVPRRESIIASFGQ